MKSLKTLALLGLLVTGTVVWAYGLVTPNKTSELLLNVQGMTCEACAVSIESSLTALDGVESVRINVPDGKAMVAYLPEKVKTSAIVETVNNIGFTASLATDAQESTDKLQEGASCPHGGGLFNCCAGS